MKNNIESYTNNKKEEEKPEEDIVLSEAGQIESIPIAELRKLKNDIEQCKEYTEYKDQKVNFETLDNLLNEIDMLPLDEDKLDNIPVAKRILSEHIENVKRLTNDYYQKIESIEHTAKIQKERLDEEAFKDWLHKQDTHRRQIHEALIDSLKIITRFCVNKNKDFKIKTLFSLTGSAFPQNKLFSATELNDRNYVRDWAFRVEKGRPLKELHDHIEKQINEMEKKPE
jgi:hypothetical protein